MLFFNLIRREIDTSPQRLIVMFCLGGLSNAAMIAAINVGAQAGNADRASAIWAALMFVIALLLFIKTQNFILVTTAVEIESIIHGLRIRLLDGVRKSELLAIEAIGRSRIIGAIANDTQMLTQASKTLAFAGQGLTLVVFISCYVAFLSITMFLLSAVIITIVIAIFHAKGQQISAGEREAAEWRGKLLDRLTDALDGFKEVRLNRSRSASLFDDVVEMSRQAANSAIWKEAENLKRLVFSQSSMFLLLGAVVFVAPVLSSAVGAESLTKATTAVLFATGACFGLVQSVPVLQMANAAAERIEQLDRELRATAVSADLTNGPPAKPFEKIEMRAVEFNYVEKGSGTAFHVGPLDFVLEAGDLVIVTGGNGSGKSTFLKLLAGLYPPRSGQLSIDGKPVDDASREAFRIRIAAIFTDYHLFARLYGIDHPDPKEVGQLLEQFELDEKTAVADGRFSTMDLSGGQRKRLALIVSLLEKRPVLLLDEWTADQDPEFRQKFYAELLPAMHRAGMTLVIITHDDRYLDGFALPARRLHMNKGRFVEQNPGDSSDADTLQIA